MPLHYVNVPMNPYACLSSRLRCICPSASLVLVEPNPNVPAPLQLRLPQLVLAPAQSTANCACYHVTPACLIARDIGSRRCKKEKNHKHARRRSARHSHRRRRRPFGPQVRGHRLLLLSLQPPERELPQLRHRRVDREQAVAIVQAPTSSHSKWQQTLLHTLSAAAMQGTRMPPPSQSRQAPCRLPTCCCRIYSCPAADAAAAASCRRAAASPGHVARCPVRQSNLMQSGEQSAHKGEDGSGSTASVCASQLPPAPPSLACGSP